MLNKEKRDTSFPESIEAIEKELAGGIKNDDPEQYYSIGFDTNGKMLTVVYELREDNKGMYVWIVTLWKTTKEEKARLP